MIVKQVLCVFAVLCASGVPEVRGAGPDEIRMIEIPPGEFIMGSRGYGAVEEFDEAPAHLVRISKPLRMSATEITNAQYERYDPAHRALRGKAGFSVDDDEAVVFVSYDDALGFCRWLSQKEGKSYRLPTEAEWEYACRAGSTTPFNTGTNGLPALQQKEQKYSRNPKPVSLRVAMFPPNDWGLYDMHGNVEEWCLDWYGPYPGESRMDPAGPADGLYRVTRGGSHNTPVRYLRSANRSAMIPEDATWAVGFRVVEAGMPAEPDPAVAVRSVESVSQRDHVWPAPAEEPFFREPVCYVHKPAEGSNVPFYGHNHCPAITWCPNGDLLAAWFSTDDEAGREMVILSSRLRAGSDVWDAPSEFLRIPDRNLTGTSLLCDGEGAIYHTNGVEVIGGWKNLAIILRESRDNGATWSRPRLIVPEHDQRHQVIAGLFLTREGYLVQPCDAVPGHYGGSAVHISRDKGLTWENPYMDPKIPAYADGAGGGLIAGIHAGVVQHENGDLMALGRNNDIEGGPQYPGLRMPCSVSADMGRSWTYSPTEFLPLYSGQRLVLRRLNEGPLLLISFTHHPGDKMRRGMEFEDASGYKYTGYGMFAALSFDEGKTRPVKRLLTDGKRRLLDGRGWTGYFEMTQTQAEPLGYLAATQTPDNTIHLISSNIHYRFNMEWIMQKPVLTHKR